jgi:hypothetical protein
MYIYISDIQIILLWIVVAYMVSLGFADRNKLTNATFTSFANKLLTCGAFYAFPFLLSANVLVKVAYVMR